MSEYDVKRLGLIFAVNARIEGMKAENEVRRQKQQDFAYSENF